ncbi:TonB-dependent receptor [Pedobacter nutrimenti]|uniref:SusC/RagA family TonB-linked outer membrane protein n=1 Tax=Pedobacter nutrimenti TaxID=1241337 RepID=UPI0029302ED2|nr:TonB-dependent receptor [Pedobacter nutrimenti]
MQPNLLKPLIILSRYTRTIWSFLILFVLLTISPAHAGMYKSIKKKAFYINTIVKGKVIDKTTGETLPGVSVKIKNSSQSAVTDGNGSFVISSSSDSDILQFSYVGYEIMEIAVTDESIALVKLQPSSKKLNEIVVVGYGTQKKTSLTSAVSTISVAEITQKPVVNLTNSLVGRASGVIATQAGGEPGFDGSKIYIRGIGSTGGGQPLLIVDGVPRDFSRLDPNTIDNISVLKDAAAVAPYGVAGANGVILVTTKQGKQGKPTLTYNGYFGLQNPTKVPDFVNSYEYAMLRNEANANDGRPVAYTPEDLQKFKDHSDPDGHPDSSPLKEIIKKNRPITYHNLSLSGGAENIKYFASLGYNHQAGMWSTTYTDKYNGTLNITANPTKTTTVALGVTSFVEDNHFPTVGADLIIGLAQRQTPVTPVYYSNGLWSGYIGQSLIGEIYNSGYRFNEKPTTQSQLSIDQKLPIEGLSLKGVVSFDNSTEVDRIWQTPIPFYNVNTKTTPYTYVLGTQGSSKSQFTENYYQTHSFTYQGILNYQRSFGKSDITALAVVESRIIKYQQFGAYRQNYNLDIDELNFGGPASTDQTNQGFSNGQKQLGYVYRVGYAYDKKYLFEATGRYDGSYLFAPGHRFGFFPAFSAGWRLSEEKFIKDNFTWIDNLKLRASWGQSGAYPVSGGVIQTYQYLSPYTAYGNSAVIDGQATQGLYEALQGNPNITWEKSTKTNVGFEASLWKGILSVEMDYFHEKRANMLVSIGNSLPGEYGIGTGLVNGGIMTNHGIDVTLKSTHQFSSDLRLDLTGTFTFAKNKLLQVYETDATYNNPNRRITGRALNTQFGYQALGYFTSADFNNDGTLKTGIPNPTFGPVHPGDLRYADLSGPDGKPDGKIDANDQTVIGKPKTPEIIYGFEPRLTYKNFDLDILIQGSGNSNIQLGSTFVYPFNASGSATKLVYDNHWTPDNPNALYPRITGTPTSNNMQTSSWYMRNASYIRLKSFELGYTFSNKSVKKIFQSLRVYAAGQNVFTWLPGVKETIDPETNGSNTTYYQQRVISFGLNATF